MYQKDRDVHGVGEVEKHARGLVEIKQFLPEQWEHQRHVNFLSFVFTKIPSFLSDKFERTDVLFLHILRATNE